MKLNNIIDFREGMESTISLTKVVAEVSISSRNFLGQSSFEKSVKLVELKEPLRVTPSFVDTRDVPFIYAQRKDRSIFNYLDTSGRGIFLCTSMEHLNELLPLIVKQYDEEIKEMQLELNDMLKNNRTPFHLLEIK